MFMSFVRDISLQKKIDLKDRINRIGSHLIPLGGVSRRIHGERVILAGDAAGFVDPFLGEGLYYAVKSGEIAADVAALAVENDDFSREFLALILNPHGGLQSSLMEIRIGFLRFCGVTSNCFSNI
jgi:flavin-dependent dehydrogenase